NLVVLPTNAAGTQNASGELPGENATALDTGTETEEKAQEQDSGTGETTTAQESGVPSVQNVTGAAEAVRESLGDSSSQAELMQHAINTIDKFPTWHPFKQQLHVELYEELQKRKKQPFPEPIYMEWENTEISQLEVFKTLAPILDFELKLPFLEFFDGIIKLDHDVKFTPEYAQDWGNMIMIPLFYLRHLITSMSVRFMCLRTCLGKAAPQMFKTKLKTKHMLYVAYLNPQGNASNWKPGMKKFLDDVTQSVKSVFHSFSDDELQSLENCYKSGNAFVLFTLNAGGTARTIIGVVLFSADEHGIWVNWLTVADKSFDRKTYGRKATCESFRNCGFGTLLMLLIQLCSIVKRWSTDVYLQANQLASAVWFYTQVGFKKMDSNNIQELPKPWQTKVNNKEISDFYVKFVDDETNMVEALRRAKDNKEEVNLLESLHLYKLTGSIRSIHYPCTLDTTTRELCFMDRSVLQDHVHVPLLPPNDSNVMFPFPYKEVGCRWDISTSDLLIFGNRKFDFNDDYNFLHLD
ncbi:MAG TPA: GNAT family N-acetyltransferase, partial [Phormidium sp.]